METAVHLLQMRPSKSRIDGDKVRDSKGVTRGQIIKFLSPECHCWYTNDSQHPDELDILSPPKPVILMSNPPIAKIPIGVLKDNVTNKQYKGAKPKSPRRPLAYITISTKDRHGNAAPFTYNDKLGSIVSPATI